VDVVVKLHSFVISAFCSRFEPRERETGDRYLLGRRFRGDLWIIKYAGVVNCYINQRMPMGTSVGAMGAEGSSHYPERTD
jgi:hypothetical protein